MVKEAFVNFALIILSIVWNAHSLSHKSGSSEFSGIVLYEQNLFSRYSQNPQDYTIEYRYLNAATLGTIFNVQLDVNGANKSEANIEFSKYVDLNRNRFVNATVLIQNATNFISTIEISGLPGIKLDLDNQLIQLLDFNIIKARSYALICTQNTEKHSNQTRRIYEYGNRENGDFLVHFQNEYVNASKAKISTINFDFEDLTVKISNVVLVSDSPWAIIFANRVQVSDHRLRATVYGLDGKPFLTRLIIFGTSI